ncbi:MAG: ABC transporter permease [Caldilineaceae bacterium]|nr:ABC transporter permease [Caldilineaceae bacterium]
MGQYILRRLLLIPILLLGITAIDFIFINMAPGDPITAMLDPAEMRMMTQADIDRRRAALGLDQPVLVRYFLWLKELSTGNLGHSYIKAQPVSRLMIDGIKNTILLMGLSLVVTTMVGVALGIISALKPYSWVDYTLTALSFSGVAMPSFFFALILIFLGALKLGWFPTSGLITPGVPYSLMDQLRHMVLPLIALSIGGTASLLRYTRSSMLEVLQEEYITTARAKGLSTAMINVRHAFKNAALPIITILGLQIPGLFGGAVIIETIFSIPGIGSTMVEAMGKSDYPVMMGGILLSGITVLFSNLLADVAYAFADPRIALSGE